VPRAALKQGFLLHGMLAVSALEIAMCDEAASPAPYICAALEYYDKASSSFRAQLSNVTPENHHCMYIFSAMATAINMAIPLCMRDGDSTLQRMVVLFELLIGASFLAVRNFDWLMESPLSGSIVTAISLLKTSSDYPLDGAVTEAFVRLDSVVDSESGGSRDGTYTKVVAKLHYCFVEDAKDSIKDFCIVFPVLADQEFTVAFRNLEPVPLFILMHWAVLLHKQCNQRWCAASVGRNLVLEISDTLLQLQSKLSMMPEWQDGISWAREQIGPLALS
jgi:hypothetical protein